MRREAELQGLNAKESYALLQNPLKTKLRDQLVSEQGGLCAYCMCRIPPETDEEKRLLADNIAPIVLEHIIPESPKDGRNVGQGLDYKNLVAVCHGNRAASKEHRKALDLTCDAHRGNTEFKRVNPCDASTLISIEYEHDGQISATDPDVKFDLDQTLNLNYSLIKSERKAALDALTEDMEKLFDDETALNEYIRMRLKGFESETDPKTPYVGILIWYLQGFLKES